MLKWLKQKPANGNSGSTTDDPLATIQVHHPVNPTKTSFNKKTTPNPNEIYAVSRVNPLFEEDDTNKGPLSPGNHSGSSGYDSGPSDDESPTGSTKIIMSPDNRIFNAIPSNSGISNSVTGSQRNIFLSPDDLLIHQHHETKIYEDEDDDDEISLGDTPILNVIKQNPNYVNSISVAIEPPTTGRPLTPIAESKATLNPSCKRINAIPLPLRNVEPPLAKRPGDKIGAARLIQRNSNYVQSIRIVPNAKSTVSFSNPSVNNKSGLLLRKPSVTFSEKVEVVNNKQLKPQSRRQSLEQDSIVTESLLMMTSGHQLFDSKHSKRGGATTTTAQIHDNKQHGALNDEYPVNQSNEDLTTFSNSLSQNRIVIQYVSRSSASSTPDILDEDIMEEHIDTETTRRRPRSNTATDKSPFGGIADHYAAAKEIAKEIESYASGTTKSTRISLVKDLLLSSRGRIGAGYSSPRDEIFKSEAIQNPTIMKAIPISSSSTKWKSKFDPVPSRGDHLWETVKLQVQPQVYVKANDGKMATTKSTSGHFVDAKSQPQLTNSTLNYSHLPSSSRNPDSHYHQNEGQDQIPIYEALPPGTSSHLHHHPHEDSDSGNSTDRNPKEENSGDESPIAKPANPANHATVEANSSSPEVIINTLSPNADSRITNAQTGPTPQIHDTRNRNTGISHQNINNGLSNNDKVMIVSGDSQNMVVDLSAVPPDLRDAIISGTALVTVTDGLNTRLEPGYTMVAIPKDHDYEILPSPQKHPKNHKDGIDNYATKNLTQVWDVMQYKGKGKRLTTVLPYHPNQDSHTTADFTIEGQPLARQTKRVQRLKKRRCFCRIVGMIVFLVGFLGVIVTLSLIYTKGKHYFGPV